MLRIFGNKKAQNTAEYVILFSLIAAAAIAMQTYVKRGLQGRVKDGVDKLASDTSGLGATRQYEPYYMESSFNTARDSRITERELTGGARQKEIAREETSRTGYQKQLEPNASN